MHVAPAEGRATLGMEEGEVLVDRAADELEGELRVDGDVVFPLLGALVLSERVEAWGGTGEGHTTSWLSDG